MSFWLGHYKSLSALPEPGFLHSFILRL